MAPTISGQDIQHISDTFNAPIKPVVFNVIWFLQLRVFDSTGELGSLLTAVTGPSPLWTYSSREFMDKTSS